MNLASFLLGVIAGWASMTVVGFGLAFVLYWCLRDGAISDE